MNSFFAFLYFNFFADVKKNTLLFFILWGLFLDLIIYHFYFFNTLLFLFLYLINYYCPRSRNFLGYALKSILNLTIGFIIYALYSGHFFFPNFYYAYLSNFLLSIILYKTRKHFLELR